MKNKKLLAITIVLTLALSLVGVVYAQDIIAMDVESDEMEAYGTVEELALDYLIVDGVRYELTMDTEIEEDIAVGDWVKVKYYVEDELNIAIEIELEDADEEEDDDMDDENMEDSAVCSGALIHPALESLAMEYDVDYEELVTFFCDSHLGVGEIKLALETAEDEELDLSWKEILEMRLGDDEDDKKDSGWGQIWQELGLIGKDADKEEGNELEGFVNQNKEKNAEKGKTNKDNKGKSNRP